MSTTTATALPTLAELQAQVRRAFDAIGANIILKSSSL